MNWRDDTKPRAGDGEQPGISMQLRLELEGELLAAIEAWREVNLEPNLESAALNLIRRALMDEVSEVQNMLREAKARMGLDGGK